jgi:hypothetical protein
MFDITPMLNQPFSTFAMAKNAKLRLNPRDFKSDTIRGIAEELEERPEVMDFIRGGNLRGGDFLEMVASELARGNIADLKKLEKEMH